MLGNIWNDLCTGTGWMMEHLVLINILLSFVIIFFQRRKPQTVWTLAARTIFYTNCWICIVSADRTRFPKEQNV